MFHFTHLLFVPGLCFRLAAVGDVLILSTHFSHNGVHVQATAVVHLHDDGGVLDLALQLTELLQNQWLLHISSLFVLYSSVTEVRSISNIIDRLTAS